MCNSKRLCDKEDCEICFNNSFASHEKSEFWSDKNIDNNGNKISPRQVFKKSNKKYLFNCHCGHELMITLNSIACKGSWCVFCSHQKLCDKDDCETCFNNSFASNEKSKYWSNKNNIIPRKVFKSSGNKYVFNCHCGHDFECGLNGIISKNSWCPYCSNPPKQLCDKEDCESCFEK